MNTKITDTLSTQPPKEDLGLLLGFYVPSDCGRAWFVPLAAVGNDYADFLMQADHLSPEEAQRQAHASIDFWPTWFAQQCNLWGDIEHMGKLVKNDGVFKTKKALDKVRGRPVDAIGDYKEVFAIPNAITENGAKLKRNTIKPR